MNRRNRSTILAAAIAIALGLPAIQAEAGISFKNNGVGPMYNVDSFNLNAGDYLLQGIGPSNNDVQFQFYGQSVIGNWLSGATALTAATGMQYTAVIAAPLIQNVNPPNGAYIPTTLTSTLGCGGVNPACAQDATNYFEIWYGANVADPQPGTGFRGTVNNSTNTLILSGHVVQQNSFNLTDNSSYGAFTGLQKGIQLLDSRPGGNFSTSNSVLDPARSTFGGSQFLTTNVTGAADFLVEVDFSNSAFFNGAPDFVTANFTVDPNSQFNDPFTSIAPSTSFAELNANPLNLGTASGAFVNAFLGSSYGSSPTGVTPTSLAALTPGGEPTLNSMGVNSFYCSNTFLDTCDFLAQGSGSGSLSGNFIPEPGSLVLLGLGLAGLGFFSRKRLATLPC